MVKICNNCGTPLDVNTKVCTECGTSMEEMNRQEEMMGYPQEADEISHEPMQKEKPLSVKGSKYEPITTGGYLGIMLLMCVPIVGIVFAVKWALGGCRKVSKRNFARASLIMMGISFVMSIFVVVSVSSVINTVFEEMGVDPADITSIYDLVGIAIDLSAMSDFSDMTEYGYEEDASGKSQLLQQLAELRENGEITESDLENIEGLEEAMNYLGYDTTGGDYYSDPYIDDYSDPYEEEYSEQSPDAYSQEPTDASSQESTDAYSQEPTDAYSQEPTDPYSDEYVEGDYIDEAASTSWPSGLREYTHGTRTDMAENYIEISQTNRDEMMKYVDQLKGDGFKFLDFYEYEMSESEMLEMDEWCATNGRMFVNVYNYDDIVVIEYMEEVP